MRPNSFSLLVLALFLAPWLQTISLPAAEIDDPASGRIRGDWRHEELRLFKAREAHQGVAADGQFLYVISNRAIGKYRADTGERVGGWTGEKDGPIVHLNSGTVRTNRLYVAHSNYPDVPMLSSVEVWDTETMQHVSSHSLGMEAGSLTWVLWRDGHWFACFANYASDRDKTGRDPSWTQVVQFDEQWRRVAGWGFPSGLIKRFAGNSCSGGAFGPDGVLFVSGHDARELYLLQFPVAASVMTWSDTVSISAEGQAFDFDPVKPDLLYSIARRSGEVIVSRLARTQ
jgi:outer membrane protein assembly factor BamB